MKKKIDTLLSLYRQTEEINGLAVELSRKQASLRYETNKLAERSFVTEENIIKRKKVYIKVKFIVLLSNKRIEKNISISSLRISYNLESGAKQNEPWPKMTLSGIYLCLHLKTKTGSQIDIAIAYNDCSMELPMLNFVRSQGNMQWETCTIEFKNGGDRETIIEFCESALFEVNQKLAASKLEKMKKRFHVH